MGPKLRQGILVSSASPSAPARPTLEPCPVPSLWGAGLRGGVGVHSHFQVFPALGQPGSRTNQLLQAQGVGGGVRRRGRGSSPRLRVWWKAAVMGLSQRQPCPWLLLLLGALVWPQPGMNLGEWGSRDWTQLWGTCWSDGTPGAHVL